MSSHYNPQIVSFEKFYYDRSEKLWALVFGNNDIPVEVINLGSSISDTYDLETTDGKILTLFPAWRVARTKEELKAKLIKTLQHNIEVRLDYIKDTEDRIEEIEKVSLDS